MIELIITIFVIIVALIGVFVTVQHSISYIQPIFSRLTAAYLAQEGIEIVRNLRDENWLDEDRPYWYSGLGGTFKVSYNQGLGPCGSCEFEDVTLPFLEISSGPAFYNYDFGSATRFKRKVEINQIDNPPGGDIVDYLEVKVLVEWEEKGERDSFLVQENLYPWWPPQSE